MVTIKVRPLPRHDVEIHPGVTCCDLDSMCDKRAEFEFLFISIRRKLHWSADHRSYSARKRIY